MLLLITVCFEQLLLCSLLQKWKKMSGLPPTMADIILESSNACVVNNEQGDKLKKEIKQTQRQQKEKTISNT